MQILLRKLFPNDTRFHKRDAVYLVASLSRHQLSIVGYIVYYKNGRRFDFSFEKVFVNTLKYCLLDFQTVINVTYRYQAASNLDLKDALAQALLEKRSKISIEFESSIDKLRPTKVGLLLGSSYFVTHKFTVSG